MGSRDRLAQIRAQQAARAAPPQQAQQYDEPAPIRPPRQSYEQPHYDQFQDPYAGSQPMTQRAYSNESAPERRPSSERQRSHSGRSQSQPRGLPSGGPRPQRRPTNEMPSPQDQYQQGPGAYGGGAGYDYQQPTYDRDPPRDFNPNAASPQPSQYSPAPPRVTRQRSISGGQRVSLDEGQLHEAPQYAPPRQQAQQQQQPQYTPAPASRSSEQTRQRTTSDETEGPYAYSEKGSTVNLVERGGGMEMQQRGGKMGGGPARPRSKPKPKRGGPTIKMGDVPHEEMGAFFAEVSDLQSALREANGTIQQVQALHMRILSLPSADDPQAIALSEQLATTTNDTRTFFASLKARIFELEQGNANLRALIPAGQSQYNLSFADVDARQTQVSALKERFKESIQRYAEVERESRSKNRARMERQVKIVNPGLSQSEITDVVRQAEEGGGNMFSQALLQSNGQRSYAARGALREVESRAAELARIEQTLIELAQLFNDMANLVEAQDVQIIAVEQKAAVVQQDVEKGFGDTKKAVKSARSARKMRWLCFGITMIILIIVVIVIVFEVVLPMIKKNNDKAAAASSSRALPASSTTQAAVSSAAVVNAIITSSSPTSAPTSVAQGSGNGGFTAAPTA